MWKSANDVSTTARRLSSAVYIWHYEASVNWMTTFGSVMHAITTTVLTAALSTDCGQVVGWIKMKLGTEVGLGPGRIVLDGDPVPP